MWKQFLAALAVAAAALLSVGTAPSGPPPAEPGPVVSLPTPSPAPAPPAGDAPSWFACAPKPPPEPPPEPEPEPPPVPVDELDPAAVRLPSIEAEVAAWPITAKLEEIAIDLEANRIRYRFTGPEWISVDGVKGNVLVAAEVDGRLEGGSWEWIRTGQFEDSRLIEVRIRRVGKQTHNSALQSFRFAPGTVSYFAVAGLCRGTERGSRERTQWLRVVWP